MKSASISSSMEVKQRKTLLKRFEKLYEKQGMFQCSAAVLNTLTSTHKFGVLNKSNHTAKTRGQLLEEAARPIARSNLMSLHLWGTLRNVKSEIWIWEFSPGCHQIPVLFHLIEWDLHQGLSISLPNQVKTQWKMWLAICREHLLGNRSTHLPCSKLSQPGIHHPSWGPAPKFTVMDYICHYEKHLRICLCGLHLSAQIKYPLLSYGTRN